jgi:putative ABC transport system permease protein
MLRATVFGPMRHAPARTILSVIAIALGVTLGLAIHLINTSAADEMSLAARSLYGLADLTVEGSGDGFDERLYPQIARVAGVAAVSPVVEVDGKLVGRRGTVRLIGVDPFRSKAMQAAFAGLSATMSRGTPGVLGTTSVFLSSRAGRELGLVEGDALELQVGLSTLSLEVVGVLPAAALGNRAALLDIATVQWRFERLGKLSRLDLRLAPGTSPAQVEREIRAIVPPDVRVIAPGAASDDALRLSRAYRSNLTALALVALFTGGFFVYSTQALAVLRRRREHALLHALGLTRREQWFATLLGAAMVGIAGAVLGVVGGIAIARAALAALGGDLGAGFFRGTTPTLQVHSGEIVAFCVIGAAVAMAGALRPAFEASRIPTARALKSGDVTSDVLDTHGGAIVVGLIVAVALLLLPPVDDVPLAGYGAIASLVLTTVIAVPSLMKLLLARLPRTRGVAYEIARAQLRGTARYAALSVAAVVVSFSLMVAMAIMVLSFRASLAHWTEKVLPADLYLRAGYINQSSYFDPATLETLRGIDGVARVEGSRFAEIRLEAEAPAMTLVARPIDAATADATLWLVTTTRASAPDGALSVWISESAADQLALGAGGRFAMPLGGKAVQAFVRGVWRDYEHQGGAIVMDHADYVRVSGDRSLNMLWLWLATDADVGAIEQTIRARLPHAEYDMRTPRELRALSLQAFDRTFAVTYALEVVAVLIGLFGIAAGASAQVLARRAEFGVLRHLGFTRASIAGMLALEGSLLGALGVVAGLICGSVVSLILIYVVNRQSFHWSMDLTVPVGWLAMLSGVLIGASALIAVWAGRRAMGGDAVAAVKEDW